MKAMTVINGAADRELSAVIERCARTAGFRTCRIDDLTEKERCLPGTVLYVDRTGEEKYRELVSERQAGGCPVISIPGWICPFTYKDFTELTAACLDDAQMSQRDLLYGELVIDREQHIIIYRGQEMLFGPCEYEVLVYLLEHAGKAVSREEINKILPERKRMTERNIDTHIKNIRRVLDMKKVIVSVRSVGYRIDPDELYNWITGSR